MIRLYISIHVREANIFKRGYRVLVPGALRVPFWHLAQAVGANDIRTRRRHLREFRMAARLTETVVRVNGLAMRIDLRDEGVAHLMYDERDYEAAELSFVRSQLKAGSIFIDIGANIGYYSVSAAKVIGPSGIVVSIEPDPHNFALLQRNLRRNGVIHIAKTMNVALGSTEGTARLYRSATNFGDHRLYAAASESRGGFDVRVRPLDQLVQELSLERIDLIKMDVQGFECQVLKGMAVILDRYKPAVITEFWPEGLTRAGGSPEEFLAAFEQAGYEASLLGPSGLERIPFADILKRVPKLNPVQPDASYLNVVFRASLN